ncbi:Hypothetical protein, putative [Bodo saltans]|uniref:Membrane-associated protein n=1 Tax=Bodo saltans TaxID=75058 RepID=A0A0S4J9W2_BODSA|nr:Hypothetical protein, putative [Bodo saltans]|eukprot:CUG85437.1 Hypothetical protein, putative [Bodo saltans]
MVPRFSIILLAHFLLAQVRGSNMPASASPSQRLVRLHVVLREGKATKASYTTGEVARGATLEVYANTTFGTIRRMIDAHVPREWAERLQNGQVELFLAALRAQVFSLDDTMITPEDTLITKGLGSVEQLHLIVFIDGAVEADHRTRSWSNTSGSPHTSVTDTASSSSPTGTIGRSGRLSLAGPSPTVTTPEVTVVFVRVIGAMIPKTLRVVLECSPQTFIENVFVSLEAKLLQLGSPTPKPLLSSTHAFYLFLLVGVGTGKAGRRIEPLERIQHLIDEGSNVLTVCLREYTAVKPQALLEKSHVPLAPKSSATDLRKCFVTSSAWDGAIEGNDESPPELPAALAVYAPEIAEERAESSAESNHTTTEIGLPPPPPATLRIQLDLPLVNEDSTDDCDPSDNAVHQFSVHQVVPSSTVPMPLEDAFDLLPSSDDDDEDTVTGTLRVDGLVPSSNAADWQKLPFSFLTLIGSGCPARFVDDVVLSGLEELNMNERIGNGLVAKFVLPDVEAIERDLREEEMILAFDLFEDLTAKEVTVLNAHSTDIITAELLRTILHTMGDFDEVQLNTVNDDDDRRSNESRSPSSDDFLTRDWDLADVETVVALPPAPRSNILPFLTTPNNINSLPVDLQALTGNISPPYAAVASPSVQPLVNHHPLSQWPGFCGPQPNTPIEVAAPLHVSKGLADRITQSERQHDFFRQQVLAPLLPEHRRIHIARDQARMDEQRQQNQQRAQPRSQGQPSRRAPPSLPAAPSTVMNRNHSPGYRDHSLPQLSAASPIQHRRHVVDERQHDRSGQHLERMNVVASIYRPPEVLHTTPLIQQLHQRHHIPQQHVSRSLPLPDIHRTAQHHHLQSASSQHAAANVLSQSQNLRGSFGRTSYATREQNPNDVFSFLSQTLRNIHDDAMTLPGEQNGSGPDGSHGQLDLLRSAAVATYTQRLLLEHRDLAQRAAELARMFQSSPPTSQLGSSQRLYQNSPSARFGSF